MILTTAIIVRMFYLIVKCYLPRISEIIDIEKDRNTYTDSLSLQKIEIERLKYQIRTHPEKDQTKTITRRSKKTKKKH